MEDYMRAFIRQICEVATPRDSEDELRAQVADLASRVVALEDQQKAQDAGSACASDYAAATLSLKVIPSQDCQHKGD